MMMTALKEELPAGPPVIQLATCSVHLCGYSDTTERLDFFGTGTETQSVVNELPEAGAVEERRRAEQRLPGKLTGGM